MMPISLACYSYPSRPPPPVLRKKRGFSTKLLDGKIQNTSFTIVISHFYVDSDVDCLFSLPDFDNS
jgi:hypothetical protein